MFASKRRPFALTLLISVIVALALVTAADADSVQRRDHLSLKRVIKKRSPQAGVVPAGGAADPAEPSGSGSAAPVAPSASSNPSPSSASQQETPSESAQQPSASANPESASSPSPSASQAPSQSQDAPSETSNPTPTPPPSNDAPAQNEGAAVTPKNRSTVIHTETAQPSQTASNAASSSNTSSAGKTTLTVFIAIIASVAGATIIWTIFRKWKLARSSQFDARMNPIDWQPSADETRRHSSASSFHSSGHGHSHMSHGYGATDANSTLPNHDFTAGPAHLAPVGGYADLARGPSPQPQMHETLNHGPSLTANYGAQPSYGAQEYYGTGKQY